MNEQIKQEIEAIIVEEVYSKFTSRTVRFCANEIINRENKTGIDTFLIAKAFELESFDRRTVGFNCFMIADSFKKFSEAIDFSKLLFFDDKEILSDFLKEFLESYFINELKAINKSEPAFAVNVLKSVVYENTDNGYEAEEFVLNLLKKRYE